MQIKRFPLGMLWTNCYLVWNKSGDAVLVDPGGPTAEVRAFLEQENLTLRRVLLTHGHGDHIFGVGEIRSLARDGVAIHAGDAACLTDAAENLSGNLGQPAAFDSADHILKDGETLSLGDMTIRVLHTPGHTRGGCCFYITEGEDAVLLSGDTLFARSIGRSDLPGGDEGVLIESLTKLADFPDSLRVYPGHGPDTTIGEERRLNPFWPR